MLTSYAHGSNILEVVAEHTASASRCSSPEVSIVEELAAVVFWAVMGLTRSNHGEKNWIESMSYIFSWIHYNNLTALRHWNDC